MAKSTEKISVGFLFDDTLDSTDGVAQQVKRLGEYLSQSGHKVVYLCGETKLQQWSGGKVYSLSKNISVRFNGNRLSMPLFSSRRKIKQVLKAEELDIVHVMTPYSPFMAQRVIAAAYRQNIPVVGSFHILPSGRLSTYGARLLGYLQFWSLKKVQTFTSTSQSAATFAKKAMGINSVVVSNMIDIAKFKSGRDQKKVKGRIVFLGRLVGRKGCEQLIRAFYKILESEPDATLVIVGDGPDRRKLETLISRLGLTNNVEFLGFISESDKPQILGSAEIACFPALYGESFGLVLIEAMAAGANIVLAGDNPGYRSVLGSRPELLVDPNNTELFAQKIVEFLRDNSKQRQIHDWQQAEVKKYDINVVGKQMLDIYNSAIARFSKTRHNNAHES